MSSSTTEEELTIEGIHEKYPNRWVAMTVTKRDGNGQPVAGHVVADDVDRYRLRLKITSYGDICILYGGDVGYSILM